MHGRRLCSLLLLALLPGCDEPASSPPPAPAPRADVGQQFDPRTAGSIAGRVVWTRPRPDVPAFRSIDNPLTDQPHPPPRDWPNPNAPAIAPDGGVASAVVFLRGVDPARGKPWDHPPARVELAEGRMVVVQGATPGRVGFVRAGDAVEFVSRQRLLHTVQARGDAFFSLTLPELDKPRRRALAAPGLVELTSGAAFFWLRAYLFVEHHPYFARADGQGRFRLDGVPEGTYDLVAWHPDWRVAQQERNPDSFRIQQVRFRPPLTLTRRVRVEPGKAFSLDLDLSALLQ